MDPKASSKGKTPLPFKSRIPVLPSTSETNRPAPRYDTSQEAFARITYRYNAASTSAAPSSTDATSSTVETEHSSASSVEGASVFQTGDAATDITSADGTLNRIIDNYAGDLTSEEKEDPFMHAELLNRRSFVEAREEDKRLQSVAPWDRHKIPGTSYVRERNYTLSPGPAPTQPLPPVPPASKQRVPPTPRTRTIRQISDTDAGMPTPSTRLLDRVRGPIDYSADSLQSGSLSRNRSSGAQPLSPPVSPAGRRPDASVPSIWRGRSPTRTPKKDERVVVREESKTAYMGKGKGRALSPHENTEMQRNSWATVATETNQSDWETVPGSVANLHSESRVSTVPPLPTAFASSSGSKQTGQAYSNEEAGRSSDSVSTTGFFDFALNDRDGESPVVKDVAARKQVHKATSTYSLFPSPEHTPTIPGAPRYAMPPQAMIEATPTRQVLNKKKSIRANFFSRGVIVDPRKGIPSSDPSRPLIPTTPNTAMDENSYFGTQSSVSATPDYLEPSSATTHPGFGDSRYPMRTVQAPVNQGFRNFSLQSRAYRTHATRQVESYELDTILTPPPTSARRMGKQATRDLPFDGSAPTLASVVTSPARGASQFDSSERLLPNSRERRFLGSSRLAREVYNPLDEETKRVYGKRLSSVVFALCVPFCFPGLLYGNGYFDDLLIRLTRNTYARPSNHQKKWAMTIAWAQFSVICTGLII